MSEWTHLSTQKSTATCELSAFHPGRRRRGWAEARAQADLLLPQAGPSGASDSALENLTSFLRSHIIPP